MEGFSTPPPDAYSEIADLDVNAKRGVMSGAMLVGDDERIPPGYSLFARNVRVLSGAVEAAFYSTREGQSPNPDAWEQSSQSIVEAFKWALQTPEFHDNQTADDDRTQEIGNIMSYAISQGLTEEQIVACYEEAYYSARA